MNILILYMANPFGPYFIREMLHRIVLYLLLIAIFLTIDDDISHDRVAQIAKKYKI